MSAPALSLNAWLRWDRIEHHLATMSPPPTDVLEIGAGQGAAGARLAQRYRYTGVERDPTSRTTARRRLPATARLIDDLSELEPTERFDLLCSFEVIEHVDDHHGALATWASFLRPGGHVLLSTPANPERFAEADLMAGHFRRYSRSDIADLLAAADLEPVAVEACGFPLGYVLETGRNLLARRQRAPAASGEEVDLADRTAASGRLFQPPEWAGLATRAATAPFRVMQRPFVTSDRATTWVIRARRPPAP